jgi:hypothetical protein
MIWGVILGTLGTLALVFFTGFAVTGGVSEARAEKRSHEAVVDQLAKLCVAQFKATADTKQSIMDIKNQSKWTRGEHVKEKGWAKILGAETPGEDVLKACGEMIAELG